MYGAAKVFFQNTKAILESRPSQAEVPKDAAYTEMRAQTDRFCNDMDRLSPDRSVIIVKLKKFRQLSAAGIEIGTVRVQSVEQKRFEKEAELKVRDVQDELGGAGA